MTLTQSQFNNLVKKLEVFAHRHPQSYKFRVRVLAALGSAYIILLPLFFWGLAALFIVFGFSLPLEISSGVINALLMCLSLLPLAFGFSVFKALKVYFPKPKGLELSRKTSVDWHRWHEDAKSWQMRLEFLEKQAQSQPLSLEKAWELVRLISEYRGKEAAISKLHGVLEIQPDHPHANFTLGEILVQQNDSQGISYLERAASIDFEYILPSCELLRSFFNLKGDLNTANHYQTKIESSYEIILEAQDERAVVSARDSFLQHDLPKPLLKQLSRQLSSYPQIGEAYLVRKVLKYFPECPLYVLAVSRRKPFMEDYSDERDREFLDEVNSELEFPNRILLVLLNWRRCRLKQVLRKVPHSLIQLD